MTRVVEPGRVTAGVARGPTADDEPTVLGSTGVAVGDIAIARAVVDRLRTQHRTPSLQEPLGWAT